MIKKNAQKLIIFSIGDYYRMFGKRGIYFALSRMLLRKERQIKVLVPGSHYPIWLRTGTSDLDCYRQVFIRGHYKIALSETPKIIVDAGANIGMASVLFGLSNPQAKIIAVEPESSNYEMLKKNTRALGNVEPICAALWGKEDRVNLFDPNRGHFGFRVTDQEIGDSKVIETSKTVTIDSIMAAHDIDYIDILKIDIEGAEKEVFENSDTWIEKVGLIIIELHEKFNPGCTESFNQATSRYVRELRKSENIFRYRLEEPSVR